MPHCSFGTVFLIFTLFATSAAERDLPDVYERLEKAEHDIATLKSLVHKLVVQKPDAHSRSEPQPRATPLLKQWGYLNVADSPYNASGDGRSDDTTAFQSALNDAGSQGGGVVFAPAASYYIATHLTVPPGVTLVGVARDPWRTWGNATMVSGTTLLAVEGAGSSTGKPFIFLQGPNAGVEGLSVFYPNQVEANPPTAYPFTIGGTYDDLTVKNVLLVNSYQGVDFATNPCGRHFIYGLYGQPLLTGIAVDQCYDIGRIKQVHFWPFWSLSNPIMAYQTVNSVSFAFYRSDWEVVEDVFSLGYHVGMQFRSSSNGALNGQFSNINFDDVDIGLDIQDTQAPGLQISNLNVASDPGNSGTMHTAVYGRSGGSANVVIRGLSTWGDIFRGVLWQNSGMLSLSDSIFLNWAPPNPAIELDSGRALIRGNYFTDAVGTSILIGAGTDRVLVTDNELVGNPIVNNGQDTLVANNHA